MGYSNNQSKFCICFSAAPTSGKIAVQVYFKNITLPSNTATLTAFPIPEEPKEHPYTYEWSIIDDEIGKEESGGEGKGRSGVMEGKTEQQLKLSKLEEGEYKFKVTVTGTDPASLESKGEAVGIVTVFPGKTSKLDTFFILAGVLYQ